jgi:hypothetical protein
VTTTPRATRAHFGKERRNQRFSELPDLYDMQLTAAQQSMLGSLPDPVEGAVGAVHLALEAKACMTAFSKSYPRLYDELNSSHAVIHGASNRALAVGLAIINVADEFVSPVGVRNRHNQPRDALGAIAKIEQLPRRSGDEGSATTALALSSSTSSTTGARSRAPTSPRCP